MLCQTRIRLSFVVTAMCVILAPLSAQDSQWTLFTSANSGFAGSLARSVAIDEDGLVWVASDAGLARYDGTEWTIFNAANSALPHDDVRALALDSRANLWVGTAGGLVRIAGAEWTVWTSANSAIPHQFVRSLAISPDDAVWVAGAAGIGLLIDDEWRNFSTANSKLPTNNTQFVAGDAIGSVWIGTEGRGAVYFNRQTFTVYDESNSGLPSNIVLSIAPLAPGSAYIGTWGGGLSWFDGEQWQVYSSANSGLTHNWINALSVDDCGRVWCGTRAGGVAVFDGSEWYAWNTDISPLPSNHILGLARHSEEVWIAANGGLAQLREAPAMDIRTPLNSSYCAGDEIVLDFGSRGVFQSGNDYTLQLSDEEGSFIFAEDLATVSGSCGGAFRLNLPNNLASGAGYKLRVVSSGPVALSEPSPAFTIHATPDVFIAGPTSICEGERASFSVEGQFVSYEWSTGSLDNSITVTEAGEYSVEVKNADGCRATQRIQLVVHPNPVLADMADTAVCLGQSVQLRAGSEAGIYNWTPAEGLNNPTIADPVASPLEATEYVVRLENARGCMAVDTVRVAVHPLPATPSIRLEGDTLVCDCPEVELALWFRDGEPLSDGTGTRIRVAEPGLYSVSVIDSNRCVARSEGFRFPVTSDIADFFGGGAWTLSPNPATDHVRIEGQSSRAGYVSIDIVSVLGLAQRHHRPWIAAGPVHEVVSLADLPRGAYVLRLRRHNQQIALPFVRR